MEHPSLCVACLHYRLEPASPSVDPRGRSKDEADALCQVHRARCTEGFCVLCGRRIPWASPWPHSDIGACELCYRVVFGNAQADELAEHFKQGRGRAA